MSNRLLIWEPENTSSLLSIETNQLTAEWTSETVEVEPFSKLVVSWNTTTHPETNAEIWIRVRTAQGWSMWFSYGKWTTQGLNTGSFSGQKDNFARLEIDELVVMSGMGEAVQVKAALSRKSTEQDSPLLHRIFATLFTKSNLYVPQMNAVNVALDVPKRSQLVVEDIGNIICSPTSVSMVMAYYGLDLPTVEVAKGTIDNGTSIYGNWSYNVAFASECGFKSYVHYCNSFEDVHEFLKQGKPIVASIKTKDASELIGAEQGYPSGHLVVITGFVIENETPYVLVNDPATRILEKITKKYLYEQFTKAWRNLVYVIERD